MSLLIRGMNGMGDNINQRPFVRAAAEREDVYLATPWPQLYSDMPKVKCVQPNTQLRTQAKNAARTVVWHSAPADAREIKLHYGSATMRIGSLHDALELQLPLNGTAYLLDAPDFGASPVQTSAPVAVIRPVTVRREWSAVARNCLPQYIEQAAEILQARGYHVVSVADLEPNQEWLIGKTPAADTIFHRGELSIEKLMALIAHAAIVVTPVGFGVHAAVAYSTPLIVIAGGRGGHCAPWKELDPRQDHSRVRWMMPDQYCMCDRPEHVCPKTITDFRVRFEHTLEPLMASASRKAA